jgi:P-type conjugative transfer protein TrbJ
MNAIKKTVALMLLIGVTAGSAHAIPVFDASNFRQNLLTATRTLQQVNNQIRQLQNEALMLQNQAHNLRALDFNALHDLRVALAATDRLIAEARGLAFAVTQVETQFAALYPDRYDPNLPGVRLLTDAREHWRNSLEALRTAVRVQAQVQENFRSDASVLGALVTRSQGAAGALEATQAGNQLLALSIRQQLQAQQLAISEGRAVATEAARAVAAAERARAVRVRFLGDGARYTPVAVEMFAP